MALSKGNLFPENLVTELFNKVKGRSSLAVLSAQEPVPFNGQKEFTFTFDKDVDIVAENGAKGVGGVTITPITIVPIKVEYGARVSDEFIYASEEAQINILQAFSDGFARKVAKGIDIMAMHGLNPRTLTASSVIGDNNLDSKVTQNVTYAAATADDSINAAIALVEGSDNDTTGIVISPAVRSNLAALKNTAGDIRYPDFAFGGKPSSLGSQTLEVNGTVAKKASASKTTAYGYVGDFANAFKWGFAKEIPLKVIEYGNPDNDTTAGDLQGHNQVYLRAEAYIGWAILDAAAFAKMTITTE